MSVTAARPSGPASVLRGDFISRNEPQLAWKAACSAVQNLPGLVGFWPMSSVQRSTGNAYDLSGQGRVLTYNGNPTYNYTPTGAPYLDLDGVGDYLSRADETDLDILGTETIYAAAARGLTMGGWFYFDSIPVARDQGLIGKYTGGGQQSYLLFILSNTAKLYADFSSTGADDNVIFQTVSSGQWYFIVGRFDPSTEVALFVNGTKTVNPLAIPASLFNSTTVFNIGTYGSSGATLDGRASLCFLCANFLSDTIINMLFHQTRAMYGV